MSRVNRERFVLKVLRIYYSARFWGFSGQQAKDGQTICTQRIKVGAGGGNRTHGLGIMRAILCYDCFWKFWTVLYSSSRYKAPKLICLSVFLRKSANKSRNTSIKAQLALWIDSTSRGRGVQWATADLSTQTSNRKIHLFDRPSWPIGMVALVSISNAIRSVAY